MLPGLIRQRAPSSRHCSSSAASKLVAERASRSVGRIGARKCFLAGRISRWRLLLPARRGPFLQPTHNEVRSAIRLLRAVVNERHARVVTRVPATTEWPCPTVAASVRACEGGSFMNLRIATLAAAAVWSVGCSGPKRDR
jgi:hypothetical protein